jgi:hypothetical protein
MVLWFSQMASAKSAAQRLALFARLPVRSVLAPVIGIMKGLTDPMVGLLMGQTAENVAHRFGITREQMDMFSVRSHERVIRAQDQGTLAPGGGERVVDMQARVVAALREVVRDVDGTVVVVTPPSRAKSSIARQPSIMLALPPVPGDPATNLTQRHLDSIY